MDAGVALGGASLAIQLYSACKSSYRAVQGAISQDADFTNLLCKLEIEEERFNLWGNAARLPNNDLDVPSRHLPTVLRTLECIERLLSGRQKLINRNGSSQSTNGYAYMPEIVGEAADSVIRRLRWMMSDKSYFETLVGELKAFNDSLNSLLYEGQRLAAMESFKEFSIKVLGTDNQDKLKILQCSTAGSYSDICSLAALRCLALEMKEIMPRAVSLPTPEPPERVPHLTLPERLHPWRQRESTTLNRYPHLVEWKELPPPGSEKRDHVLKRLQYLSAFLSHSLKPQNLRILTLKGTTLLPDLTKFGMVSSYPEGSGSSEPTSLHGFLTSANRQRKLPSLNDRIGLALRLSNTLLTLHTCGWLHKAIAPQNILFFQPENDSDGNDPRSGVLRSPFLVGFGYSREDSHEDQDAAYSETMTTESDMEFYRHPSSRGSNRSKFNKMYDVYSLGLVLLDIALWKSSASLCRNIPPREIRGMVVERYLRGDVAYRVGNVYQEVIETCLTGDFGERDAEKNWLEAQFLKRVVHRLEMCKV